MHLTIKYAHTDVCDNVKILIISYVAANSFLVALCHIA